jgi:hypothetical protein
MFIPFILIFGVSDERKPVEHGVRRHCPVCGTETPHHRVETRRRFTLFFIPVWRWDRRQVLVCNVCGQAREAREDDGP